MSRAGFEPATPCLKVTRGILPETTQSSIECPTNAYPACTIAGIENRRMLGVTTENVWTRVDMNAFVWTFVWT